jgi:excisionase family DNA binding protein
MSALDERELLSMTDVARLLSLSENTVRQLIKSGELPAPHPVKGTKRAKRWLRAEIELYLARFLAGEDREIFARKKRIERIEDQDPKCAG